MAEMSMLNAKMTLLKKFLFHLFISILVNTAKYWNFLNILHIYISVSVRKKTVAEVICCYGFLSDKSEVKSIEGRQYWKFITGKFVELKSYKYSFLSSTFETIK